MLFLQSVTKHADKLKQTGDSKVWDSIHSFALCLRQLRWDNYDMGMFYFHGE